MSPLGCGVEATWKRLLAGESGARRIERFDVSWKTPERFIQDLWQAGKGEKP